MALGALRAQGLLLGQSTLSICISRDPPLAHAEVAVLGRTLLFMGT